MTKNKNIVFLLLSPLIFWINIVIAATPVTTADIINARSSSTLKEVWLAGSSSTVYTIFRGFSLVCDASTVSVFNAGTSTVAQKPGSVNAGDLLAYACKRGTNVVVLYHSVEGGSFNAYLPFLPADSIPGIPGQVVLRRLKALDNSTCVSATGLLNLGTDNSAVPVYSKCSVVTPTSASVTTEVTATLKPPSLPAGGFSDTDFDKSGFGSNSTILSYGAQSPVDFNEILGIAVSTNLYRALQVSQGIALPTTGTNIGDVNFDPSFAPNIRGSVYSSIVSQGGGGQGHDWSPIIGSAGIGKKINVARRKNTSGTQASSNVFFLRNPCQTNIFNGGIGGALSPITTLDSDGLTLLVTEDTSTSSVKARLTNANAANEFAIGILSLENNWRTDIDNNQYRFVKLDGIHPEAGDIVTARASLVANQYDFFTETYSFTSNQTNAYSKTLITDVSNALTLPTVCSNLPRGAVLNTNYLFSGASTTCAAMATRVTRLSNSCSPPVWYPN